MANDSEDLVGTHCHFGSDDVGNYGCETQNTNAIYVVNVFGFRQIQKNEKEAGRVCFKETQIKILDRRCHL